MASQFGVQQWSVTAGDDYHARKLTTYDDLGSSASLCYGHSCMKTLKLKFKKTLKKVNNMSRIKKRSYGPIVILEVIKNTQLEVIVL